MDFLAIAKRLASTEKTSKGEQGDILHGIGRDAVLGQDEDSMASHTELEADDIESFDTRPKQ